MNAMRSTRGPHIPRRHERGTCQVRYLHSLASRRRDEEQGFTLIELMVVVLIIAILIAIAIPTFLGARQRAQDRAAQSDLRNGLTAEKTAYTDNQTYITSAAMVTANIEPSLKWGAAMTVSLSLDAASVCLSEASKSGTTFAILDISQGGAGVPGTYYAKGACPATGFANGAVPAAPVFSASW
jgi:type IV pilus assembly protein PilA